MITFNTDARKQIGKLISEGRKKKKMSQRELATALGLNTPQQLCNFEGGRALPPRKTMSNMLALDIVSERKFKSLCLKIIKEDLNRICDGVS